MESDTRPLACPSFRPCLSGSLSPFVPPPRLYSFIPSLIYLSTSFSLPLCSHLPHLLVPGPSSLIPLMYFAQLSTLPHCQPFLPPSFPSISFSTNYHHNCQSVCLTCFLLLAVRKYRVVARSITNPRGHGTPRQGGRSCQPIAIMRRFCTGVLVIAGVR